MPSWLINALVSIAIKVGLPWVIQNFPGIPQQVIDIINELLKNLQDPSQSNSAAKKQALAAVKACTVGCEAEVKKV